MALLYLCLLFSADFGPASAEEECNGTTAVYVAPGGMAVLQITDSDKALCPGGCGFQWWRRGQDFFPQCWKMPNCQVLRGGSLELCHITPEEAGDYTLHIFGRMPEKWERKRKCFLLQLQDPVSTPEVNYTCLLNSTVQLSCLMENGTDPSYSWSVNGTPSWLPSREVEMSYESVLRNVTCTVKNHVSEEQSQSTDVTCPGPSSAEEECNGTTAVYAAPGGSALLQITDSDRAFCPRGCVFHWRRRNDSRTVAAGSDLSISTPCRFTPDCRVLPGGSLELSHITPEQAGGYTLLMGHEDRRLHPEEWETRIKCFLLQLQSKAGSAERN
ncbi:uncharacterized protein [Ambystoma mexicanum]|uniref:uncharacterized protein isoform X2 n=1 Tax=Ambystoma mexicanum TaxID=8296 RepID=UPI0037E82AB0